MRAFLLLAVAGSLGAQTPDPRVERLVDQLMQQRRAIGSVSAPPTKILSGVLPKIPPTVCSVPLLEMQVAKDKDFTMRQMAPLRETHDAIAVQAPAPPCEP